MMNDEQKSKQRREANNEACRRYRKRRRAKINKAKLLIEEKALSYEQLHYRRHREYYIEKALKYKESNPVSAENTKRYNRRYREKQREILSAMGE